MFNDMLDYLIENFKLFSPNEWMDFDLKLSKSELLTMLFLNRNAETTMTELVEYINVPMSTATGIIDRLVRKDYIIRERSNMDRRIVILRLSDEGLDIIECIKDLAFKYLNFVLQDLTDQEKQSLLNIALKIVNSLKKLGEANGTEKETKSEIKKIDIE